MYGPHGPHIVLRVLSFIGTPHLPSKYLSTAKLFSANAACLNYLNVFLKCSTIRLFHYIGLNSLFMYILISTYQYLCT